MLIWSLFWRFALISLLAFGGGAAVPLIERIAVREQGWIGEGEFSAAFALGQVTPGPVLVAATFIGYRAAGLAGALAATAGAFLMPWALGAATARPFRRPLRSAWLRGFGRGATASAIGLLGVTALGLIRHAGAGGAGLAIAAGAFGLALATKIPPILILLGGAALGVVLGLGVIR